MARTGITYFEVEKAANKLLGLNKNVTIENIRHDLGTGSSSTIAKYLRQWKDKQNDTQQIASKEKIPETLVELIKGLWERVCGEAQESVTRIKMNQRQIWPPSNKHCNKHWRLTKRLSKNTISHNKS